jgi:hypothetical protein
LLTLKAERVDAVNSFGRTPLMEAAKAGHSAVVRILENAGANLDYSDETSTGKTALHLCAEHGHVKVVHTLLDLKKDLNVRKKDVNGDTALTLALEANHDSVAELLLANGSVVTAAQVADILKRPGEVDHRFLNLCLRDAKPGLDMKTFFRVWEVKASANRMSRSMRTTKVQPESRPSAPQLERQETGLTSSGIDKVFGFFLADSSDSSSDITCSWSASSDAIWQRLSHGEALRGQISSSGQESLLSRSLRVTTTEKKNIEHERRERARAMSENENEQKLLQFHALGTGKRKLRVCTVANIICTPVISGLAEGSDAALQTELAELILNYAWTKLRGWYYFDFCIDFFALGILVFLALRFEFGLAAPFYGYLALTVILAKRIFDELSEVAFKVMEGWEVKRALRKYFFSLETVVDWAKIFVDGYAIKIISAWPECDMSQMSLTGEEPEGEIDYSQSGVWAECNVTPLQRFI